MLPYSAQPPVLLFTSEPDFCLSHVLWPCGRDVDAKTFPILVLLVLHADKVCVCGMEGKRVILGAHLHVWGVHLLAVHRALAGVRAMSLGCAMSSGPPHLRPIIGDNQAGLKMKIPFFCLLLFLCFSCGILFFQALRLFSFCTGV